MTTIATDGKTMAGDGRVTIGSWIVTDHAVKVRHLNDGRVVGYAGDVASFEPFIDWLNEGASPDVHIGLDDEFEALVLNGDGTAVYHDTHGTPIPADLPCALGIGGAYAIGAMLAGASPAEAVEMSASKSTTTGGTILVLSPKAP